MKLKYLLEYSKEYKTPGLHLKVKPGEGFVSGAVLLKYMVLLFAVPGALLIQLPPSIAIVRLFMFVPNVLLGPLNPTSGKTLFAPEAISPP